MCVCVCVCVAGKGKEHIINPDVDKEGLKTKSVRDGKLTYSCQYVLHHIPCDFVSVHDSCICKCIYKYIDNAVYSVHVTIIVITHIALQ